MMNKITELDLSQLPKLRELAITDNRLTTIDLSKLKSLKEFYGSYNNVGTLDTKQIIASKCWRVLVWV